MFYFTLLKKIPINSPLIQEKALEITKELRLHEFKVSSGWLIKFWSRKNISFKTILSAIYYDRTELVVIVWETLRQQYHSKANLFIEEVNDIIIQHKLCFK